MLLCGGLWYGQVIDYSSCTAGCITNVMCNVNHPIATITDRALTWCVLLHMAFTCCLLSHRRCHKVTHFFVDGKGAVAKGTIMSLFGSYFDEKSPERRQSADPYALDPLGSRSANHPCSCRAMLH